MFVKSCIGIMGLTLSYRVECYKRVNISTITIINEFQSEEGEIGPFVSNEILWFEYKLCPLKSCFSAICV